MGHKIVAITVHKRPVESSVQSPNYLELSSQAMSSTHTIPNDRLYYNKISQIILENS